MGLLKYEGFLDVSCVLLLADAVTFSLWTQGNFDLVGNNFPVFFVRDGMKFPDMVHALKPNPKSHIQENWRIVDFFSHHPESLHMVHLPL